MRRFLVLTCVGGALVLAGVAWLAAAQTGARDHPVPSGAREVPVAVKVDINQADLHELGRLPGMTLQLAERIIRNRPYRKLDDLITRQVLGKKQFARIRESLVVTRVRR